MVLQQCLACNNLMTELSRACVCGHVFEEASRFIGGKRFSEYRAKLYSRLESKRMRRKARENKIQRNPHPQPINNPENRIATKSPARGLKSNRQTPARNISDKRKKRKRYPGLQTHLSCALKQQPGRGSIISPELLSRLPGALKEINRRILVQNIMWLGLQKE